jgi:hypothetical protein
MAPVHAFARVIVGLICCAWIDSIAAPFGVQVGEARIALDAPPGFSDTGFTGSPRLQELAESVTSASNRILSFAISDADLRRFTQGDTPDFRRYMTVVTPRGMEHERVSAAAFKAYAGDSLADLGPAAPSGDFLKFLDEQPHGKASLLAELRRDPEVVSVLQGTRLPGSERASVFSRERISASCETSWAAGTPSRSSTGASVYRSRARARRAWWRSASLRAICRTHQTSAPRSRWRSRPRQARRSASWAASSASCSESSSRRASRWQLVLSAVQSHESHPWSPFSVERLCIWSPLDL